MLVWLDDVRTPPYGWFWAKTAKACIDLLDLGGVTEVSLDHDLGLVFHQEKVDGVLVGGFDKEPSGYTVLEWIERQVHLRGFHPPIMHVHTDNASARPKMLRAIESIQKAAAAQ